MLLHKVIWVCLPFRRMDRAGSLPSTSFSKWVRFIRNTKWPANNIVWFWNGFFYAFAGFASHPSTAINIAYLTNLLGLLVPFYFLSQKFYQNRENSIFEAISLPLISATLVLFCLQLEKTTSGTLKIHADTPALSFILIGLCFFQHYEAKKSNKFLFFTALSLSFAIWSKLPTLPALFFPFVYFLLNRKLKESLNYVMLALMAFLGLSVLIFWAYGFDDVYYYIIQFPSGSMWSYRNDLFDGSNALLERHSFIKGVPLLFRFFIMYLSEYWYLIFSNLVLFLLSFKVDTQLKLIFRCVPIIAILTLPTCLAHLARFGAVENALVFTNSFSVLGIVLLMIYLIQTSISNELSKIVLFSITGLMLIPILRTAKALPSSTENSPQQQSFDYLKSGKTDVYFGWYPISHILHSGENFTSIEVPTWVGMNQPDRITFDISHIPKGAKFLATSPTGYGSTMLEQYIGDLVEVPAPKELSSWRLFEIKALNSIN